MCVCVCVCIKELLQLPQAVGRLTSAAKLQNLNLIVFNNGFMVTVELFFTSFVAAALVATFLCIICASENSL